MDLIDDDDTLNGQFTSVCSSSLLITSDNSSKIDENDSTDKVCIIIFIPVMICLLILPKFD
ncbi:unnamed protein product [Brugia timori]|uniref:Uncharacterized protein n=1 Tax=Brugia timori TaxID=42155 RepID=A0A0R3QE02_9BILA|nr:unnamed protein product [Brugia timori]